MDIKVRSKICWLIVAVAVLLLGLAVFATAETPEVAASEDVSRVSVGQSGGVNGYAEESPDGEVLSSGSTESGSRFGWLIVVMALMGIAGIAIYGMLYWRDRRS